MYVAILLFALTFFAASVDAEASQDTNATSGWAEQNPSWVARVPPYKISDNLYFVGSRGLAVFLLMGDEGHVLIDGGLPGYEDQIVTSLAELGVPITDVRLLLNTHAHIDHSGGLARLKELSGGALLASAADRGALETGRAVGFEDNPNYATPPVAVDRTVADQEVVTLGSIKLKAAITPGHTPGCTSWWLTVDHGGRPQQALIFCSATVAGNRLVAPFQYDGVVSSYRETFAKTRGWRPDIFLANHPGVVRLEAKRRASAAGDANAFIDREGFPKMMSRMEASFEKQLAAQLADAKAK